MNRYLITGGAGFIGSHFVKYLNEKEDAIIVILDKLTYAGSKNRLAAVINNENIHFYKGDINDQLLIKRLMIDFKINKIINFAAESHVDKSIKSQESFVMTNVLGVQNLLSVSKNYWDSNHTDDPCFIQISTDEVYGSTLINKSAPFVETDSLNPMNPYAATKASAEHLIKAYGHTFDYPFKIIRSTNNYGPDQNVEKFIPMIINNYLNHRPITIYGDGKHKRCWLHVNDNCRGIYQVMTKGKDQVYNIKGNFVGTNHQVVTLIIMIFKDITDLTYEGDVVFVKDRLGHDYFYEVSDKKITEELDFECKYAFDQGIREVILGHI